jgi:hypothetical protein
MLLQFCYDSHSRHLSWGWATVREYEQNEIADNSDDEKRIRQAENRAIKHIKDKGKIRTTPYSRYSTPARSETRPNPNSNYVRSSTPQPPFRAVSTKS